MNSKDDEALEEAWWLFWLSWRDFKHAIGEFEDPPEPPVNLSPVGWHKITRA